VTEAHALAPLGIAHLSLLHLSPPELVSTAARAGFDFVGVRVKAVTAGESQYPMEPGSPMSRETLRRLDDTGLSVRDVEFLTLGPETGRDYWQPALEAGAALSATTISVVGVDPEIERLTATLAALSQDAAAYGIVPTLEPISYQPVSTVAQAAPIATAAGAALLLDTLHLQRGGSDLDALSALAPELVPCVQICDGPLLAPRELAVPGDLPLGMKVSGGPLQIEARVLRQVPGEGELPLTRVLRALPAATPVSVEVPNAPLVAALGDLGFAERLRSAGAALTARAAEATR